MKKSSPKLTQATYLEYQMSLFGACFLSFGLGALFGGYFSKTLMYIIILAGIIMHSWGMYKIHQRNK